MQDDGRGEARHLASGDALRAIAALGVLVYHVAIGAAIVSGAAAPGCSSTPSAPRGTSSPG